MAILRMQLSADNGEVLKDYQTTGSIKVYEKVMNNAIYESLELAPQSLQPEMHAKVSTDMKENQVAKQQKSPAPLGESKSKVLMCDLPRHLDATNEVELGVKKPKLRTLDVGRGGFTVFNCPHCGRTHYGLHKIGDKVECNGCSETISVPEGLVYAQFSCPNCGQGAYAFVEKMDKPPMLNCRKCNSPIDLFFNEKKGYFIGAK